MNADDKVSAIKVILKEMHGVADTQEFGLHYGQLRDYLEQIEEIVGR